MLVYRALARRAREQDIRRILTVALAVPFVSAIGASRVTHELRELCRHVLLDGPRFATHACLELTGLRNYE